MPEPDWANLAAAIRARRMVMGAPRQADMAAKAGVSDTTWNLAETGKPVSIRSLSKIAVALEWEPDVPQLLLDGGDAPPWRPGVMHADLGGLDARSGGDVRISASGVDLDELRRLDPEAYQAIIRQAEIALDRARERRGR